jgi:serine/threonine-protein kinase
MIGKTVSHYRILERLGEGGMGVVYKAEDLTLGRTIALKFLPPELTRDAAAKERFKHEARAASALDHPNICTIHEINETDDGQMFIAMACYEGETLKKKIERGPMDLDQAVRIAIQVGEGLAKAHSLGIVHRDIKPANVMITGDNVAKILDFGLAKLAGQVRLTKTSSTLGTVAYMSPEQAGGKEVDSRTDIWSLGVVLYEMIAARLPFKGEHEQAMMYSILNEDPAPLVSLRSEAPKEVLPILGKALAKEPGRRYQHMSEMLADLKSCEKKLEVASAASEAAKPRWTKKRQLYLSAGLAVIIGLFVVGKIYLFPPPRGPIDSIAVLPLQNLSGDPNQEYFSDGMTEALITELQKIRSLRVISRTSVMRYKKAQKLLPEIARELNVRAVVEGSVLREGDNVRVNVQLIQASPEKHLWAENFDRTMKSILALQSDVAQAIAREIRVVVTPDEQKRMASSRSVNPEAHEAYLKGRFYWNKRRGEDLKTAIGYFDQAIEKDPSYATAYAGLASTYVLLPEYAGLPPKEIMPKAEAAATKALELDSTLAEAHAVLGLIRYEFDWDWAGAESEFKRAIELDPNYPTAHHWYSSLLSRFGRFDEALSESKRALELDPLSLVINENVGAILSSTGQFDKAIDQLKRALELDPNFSATHLDLGTTYARQGKYDEAIAEFRKVRELVGGGPFGLANLGYCYARVGKKSAAVKILNELFEFSKHGYSVSAEIASIYYGLGDKEKGFEWAEKAYQEREVRLVFLAAVAVSDSTLRSDQRLMALLNKIGMEK